MRFPSNSREIADRFKGMSQEGKEAVISKIETCQDGVRSRMIQTLAESSKEEGRFVRFLVGADERNVADSEDNKTGRVPQTK